MWPFNLPESNLRYCLLMLLLSVSCVAAAQTFKQGSIRLKGGEERPGFIGKIRPGSPEGVEFKVSSDSDVEIFYATDIDGYTVDNIFYSSYHTNTYRDKEWVFADVLAEGDLTLLRRNGMYFLRPAGSVEFTHLVPRKGILGRMAKACPLVAARAGRVVHDRKSLAEFVAEYNQCVATNRPNLEGMPRTFSIGVQVGYDYTVGTFTDNVATRYLSANNQIDKSYFQGGLELNFKHYKFSNAIGFHAGALLNFDSYSGTNRSTIDKARPEVNEYSFSYRELKIPLGIDVSRPRRGKIALNIRAGIILPLVLSLKSAHPYSEFSNPSGTSVTYSDGSQITGYKPKIMIGGAVGFNYRISKSYVRVQVGWYQGNVTVITMTGFSEGHTKGKLQSLSLTTTYVF